MDREITIARTVEIAGVGLHTGAPCRLRLLPAPAGVGIVFRRVDLEGFEIEALARHVARVSYATSLMKKGVLLSTTEHLLAALYASGIDNVYVELDALEVPILDGSAAPFLALLEAAGRRRLRRRRRYLQVTGTVEVSDGDRRISIGPAERFEVSCEIDFPHPVIGRQRIELEVTPESFARELGPARTFGFLDEVERLRQLGLTRGGSAENAIVLTADGILNPPLRFPDEFARHKALDIIGDFALLGRRVRGRIEAYKAGHALHAQLVTRLLDDPSLWTETVDQAAGRAPAPARAGALAAR
jgi:UDP-3-O-[3-hydroxymyristoyl] N-acetylglucosamine deacetylase